jgi:hypothetical protein
MLILRSSTPRARKHKAHKMTATQKTGQNERPPRTQEILNERGGPTQPSQEVQMHAFSLAHECLTTVSEQMLRGRGHRGYDDLPYRWKAAVPISHIRAVHQVVKGPVVRGCLRGQDTVAQRR